MPLLHGLTYVASINKCDLLHSYRDSFSLRDRLCSNANAVESSTSAGQSCVERLSYKLQRGSHEVFEALGHSICGIAGHGRRGAADIGGGTRDLSRHDYGVAPQRLG